MEILPVGYISEVPVGNISKMEVLSIGNISEMEVLSVGTISGMEILPIGNFSEGPFVPVGNISKMEILSVGNISEMEIRTLMSDLSAYRLLDFQLTSQFAGSERPQLGTAAPGIGRSSRAGVRRTVSIATPKKR